MDSDRLLDPGIVRESLFKERAFSRLWLIPLATYGVGDIITTITLLWFTDKVNEFNAVILFVVDAFGLPGFVALKLLAFGVGIGVSVLGAHWDDWVLYYFPPAVLSVIGTFVTAINLQLFLL